MKQIEIKTTVYLIAEVPDNYEPQLGLSVEDGAHLCGCAITLRLT